MEKVNKAINYSEFAGCCVYIENDNECCIGMAGLYEEGSDFLPLNDVIVYPREEMLAGVSFEFLKDNISIRKAHPLERSMYFRLWENLKSTASCRPAQKWFFSEEEVEPYLGKLVVLDFYDAENIEEHYIGKLESYDGNYFEFSYAYDYYQNLLHKELSVEDASFLRFPTALEKSLYDKVVKGLVWIS